MTDNIAVELARRVHGWKIAPKADREAWFEDDASYPCFDECGYLWERAGEFRIWNPFEDWVAAMELVRSGTVDADRLLGQVDLMASASGFPCDSTTWLLDEATPHDLALCVARAVGIEVGG